MTKRDANTITDGDISILMTRFALTTSQLLDCQAALRRPGVTLTRKAKLLRFEARQRCADLYNRFAEYGGKAK